MLPPANKSSNLPLEAFPAAGPFGNFAWFSPGNKMLAALNFARGGNSTGDETLGLYDIGTGKLLHNLPAVINAPKGPTGGVPRGYQTVVFTPDCKTLAWCFESRTVVMWDTTTGQRIALLTAPAARFIQNAAFSPDGRCLAMYLNDGTATLYEVATAGPRRLFGQPSVPLKRTVLVAKPRGARRCKPVAASPFPLIARRWRWLGWTASFTSGTSPPARNWRHSKVTMAM